MISRALAWRYGKAFFEAVVAKGQEEKAQGELAAALAALQELGPVMSHPLVGAQQKKTKLREALAGKTTTLTDNLLGLLIDKKRLELLPAIAIHFGELLDEKRGLRRARVRTARPLSDESRAEISKRLKKFSGKDIELHITEDASLIGGIVVRLGDWVIDASLRSELKKLREQFN